MYNLIIADDEVIIRNKIQNIIDFKSIGFNISAVCENGQQVLELCKKEHIHAVITDIYMPIMDGMELAEQLYKLKPDIKTVILTGFDEFDYARRAVRCRVFEYLLKPVTKKDILSVLNSIKNALDSELSQKEKLIAAEKSSISQKQKTLNALISDWHTETLEQELKEQNISLKKKFAAACILRPDKRAQIIHDLNLDGSEMLSYIMFNITSEIAKNYGCEIVFTDYKGTTVLICESDEINQTVSLAKRIAVTIKNSIKNSLEFTVSVGIGRPFDTLSEVPKSFNDAERCIENKFNLKSNFIIAYDEMSSKLNMKEFKQYAFEEQILQGFKKGDYSKVKTLSTDLFKENIISLVHPRDFYFYIKNLTANIAKTISLLNNELQDFEIHMNDLEDFSHCNIEKLKLWFIGIIDNCINHILNNTDHEIMLCNKAIEYVNENFHDHEISLMSVCEELSVSLSYFSSLFKRKKEISFVEYLTSVRIEKAKELLINTDMTVTDISEHVGYLNPNYFCSVFKKNSQMTPLVFKNNYRRK